MDKSRNNPNVELSPRQKKLMEFLSNGSKHTALDISFALHIGDARSEIRNLRKLGINVNDEWVQGSMYRYKLYWI